MELMMDREQRVREIAYGIWQEEGRPDGEAERHWFAAEALLDEEEAERERGEDGKDGGVAAETG
jgi:Protein of unknown function (DUF2934)